MLNTSKLFKSFKKLKTVGKLKKKKSIVGLDLVQLRKKV